MAASKTVALFSRLSLEGGEEAEDYWRALVVSSLLGLFEHCGPDGDNVNILLRDTGSNPGDAIDKFLKVELDDEGGIDAIVGPSLSAVAVPLSTLAGVRGVPTISFSATSRDLSPDSLFARVLPSDAETAIALCAMLNKKGVGNVALVFTDDDYGTAYRDALDDACTSLDINVFATSFQQGSDTSIKFAMDYIKGLGLNIVITVAFSESLKEIFDHKASDEQVFIGSDAVTIDGLETLVAEDPEYWGAFVESKVMRIQATGYNEGQAYKDMEARWTKLAENATLLEFFNEKLASANASLVDAAFFNETLDGMHGYIPFAYDASRTVCSSILNSSSVRQADWKSKVEAGTALWQSIVDNEFAGVSGNVRIDAETGTRNVDSSNFVMERFSIGSSIAAVPAAYYFGSDGWAFETSANLTLPPDVDVHLEANFITAGANGASVALAVLLILWSLGLIVFTWLKRKTRILSRAQPTILISFLMGVAISSCSLFFVGIEDVDGFSQEFQNFSCMAVFWFWSIGTVLTFGALTAKLYRIYRIFHNKALRRIHITNMHLYTALGVVVAVDVLILTVWTAVDPLTWERAVQSEDRFNNPTITYGQCTSERETIFMAILFTYTFALFIVGAVFSFMVRNTPSEFQESTHIVISLVSQVQLYCLGFLILFIFPKMNSLARFMVMTLVIFFNNLLLTLVIYVPKFVAMYNNTNRANSLNSFSQQHATSQQHHQAKAIGPSSRIKPQRSSATDLVRSEVQSGASPPLYELRHYPSSLEGFNRRDASVQVCFHSGHLESDVQTQLFPESILHEADEDASSGSGSAPVDAPDDDDDEEPSSFVQTIVEASVATEDSGNVTDNEEDGDDGDDEASTDNTGRDSHDRDADGTSGSQLALSIA
ncbi:Metabotropic glutamate receptor-like protein E [Hondaea fermentalgiana]|uniref:Metabotropic glutamate receptor-like protein E n=1 Tax=Hondaea fermentalgiana TaxID=2315210 RepID=A0A2R5GEA2_9STRA|nr:Metabotropic glutamate receptor-like protein E [Hondaea fermentalgiana]|eukprot:GBG29246.1 Metabotropic glutamate receptor-like protein E [Hondaea fermentalgiana]